MQTAIWSPNRFLHFDAALSKCQPSYWAPPSRQIDVQTIEARNCASAAWLVPRSTVDVARLSAIKSVEDMGSTLRSRSSMYPSMRLLWANRYGGRPFKSQFRPGNQTPEAPWARHPLHVVQDHHVGNLHLHLHPQYQTSPFSRAEAPSLSVSISSSPRARSIAIPRRLRPRGK